MPIPPDEDDGEIACARGDPEPGVHIGVEAGGTTANACRVENSRIEAIFECRVGGQGNAERRRHPARATQSAPRRRTSPAEGRYEHVVPPVFREPWSGNCVPGTADAKASWCYRSHMIRTRIQLEQGRIKHLRASAAHRSKSVAQLVRESRDHVLANENRVTARDRFMAAAGACRTDDGATDVCARHDDRLSGVFADE